MKRESKFQDGEKVFLRSALVTIEEWSYVPSLKKFTYTIKEHPGTFFFESELRSVDNA